MRRPSKPRAPTPPAPPSESWTLAHALQRSLGEDSLDEASLRLAEHLFGAALALEETLKRHGARREGLARVEPRMLLLDVLLTWDDVGLPHTSLWNLFDGLGAARGAKALPPPAAQEDPFKAFHAAFARVRRHAGRPTMAAALFYAWAALARCLEECMRGLARTLERPPRVRGA
ncbi:hypothetical protein P2318_01175 [Myxococcaceae bacterium GXIMD 01537]